jgi:NTE family protein
MEENIYYNLVLEGGGVLGVAYAGALEELEKRGILKGIVNYAGASVGSIVAGVLACGATCEYIKNMMISVDFRKFVDIGSKIKGVYNIFVHNGLCNGDYFYQWYGDIIETLTNNRNITLKQLYDKRGCKLVISVVNISLRRLELWDHKNKPDISLVDAVRASMSIQGLFIPPEIDNNLYVDGGSLCNYPIQAFHYDEDEINPHTIGLMLVSNSEIHPEYPPIDSLFQYISANVECLWSQPQKLHIDEKDWKRTIKIPTGDISFVNFSIKDEEKIYLIEEGRKAVSDYFEGVSKRYNSFKCFKSVHTREEERRN